MSEASGKSNKLVLFKIGQRVEAQHHDMLIWQGGVIADFDGDGFYSIDYDDGTHDEKIPTSLIRMPHDKSFNSDLFKGEGDDGHDEHPHHLRKLKVGMRVEALYRGRDKFHPATIVRDRGDETWDLDYDCGEVATRVHGEVLLPLIDEEIWNPNKSAIPIVGQRVEILEEETGKWKPARIESVLKDGTEFNVDYDDDDVEDDVPLARLRSLGGDGESIMRAKSLHSAELPVGMKVLVLENGADQNDDSNWHKAQLTSADSGTYAVEYKDMRKNDEAGIVPHRIRADFDDSDSEGGGLFDVGDAVQALKGGGDTWVPGTVTKSNHHRSYDIDYADGSSEREVLPMLIRHADDADVFGQQPKFAVGDRVSISPENDADEAQLGTISAINEDGTYEIDLKDGGDERGVLEGRLSAYDGTEQWPKFAVGDRVSISPENDADEARLGTISAINEDGNSTPTYEIDLKDGGDEEGVAEPKLSLYPGTEEWKKKKYPPPKYLENDRVYFADPSKNGKKQPGSVRAVDDITGLYDIVLDSKVPHSNVEEDTLCPLVFQVDDRVECRSGDVDGGSWKVGTVTGVSEDLDPASSKGRNYNVNYDEGGSDANISPVGLQDGRTQMIHLRMKKGDRVASKYNDQTSWEMGVVRERTSKDGGPPYAYSFTTDDGKVLTKKSEIDEGRLSLKPKRFCVGDRVEYNPDEHGDDQQGKLGVVSGVITDNDNLGDRSFAYNVELDGTAQTELDDKDALLVSSVAPMTLCPYYFSLGDRVQADNKSQPGTWHLGTISRVNDDDTYDVDFDDKAVIPETGLHPKLIRPYTFKKGEKVEALYGGQHELKFGRIIHPNDDGTYDIDYDDGETEEGVAAMLIRPFHYSPGMRVEGRINGGDDWEPGLITAVNDDETYVVAFDDGSKEAVMDDHHLRPFFFGPGMRVERKKGNQMATASIEDNAEEGHYDLVLDDGTKEKDVAEENLRPLVIDFHPGMMLEYYVAPGQDVKFGTISYANDDGTYGVDFDDGVVEDGIYAIWMRHIPFYAPGAVVQARSDEKSDWVPGSIKEYVPNEGTYVVAPSDQVVSEPNIRSSAHLLGARVMVSQHGGPAKEGTITAINPDGTYDIDYVDGSKESSVAEPRITSLKDENGNPLMWSGPFWVGQRVEALYRGRERFHPGTITKDQGDLSYDVKYDTGEKATHVHAEALRPLNGDEFWTHGLHPTQGERVEVLQEKDGHWKPAVIAAAATPSGPYDVAYDDDTKEDEVPLARIRMMGEGAIMLDHMKTEALPKFREDDRVEHCSSIYLDRDAAWKAGTIVDVNLDDHEYVVAYDDGSNKEAVPEVQLRFLKGAPKYKMAQKVEVLQDADTDDWKSGSVTRHKFNDGWKYDVFYDINHKAKNVPEYEMRADEAKHDLSKFPLCLGLRVKALYRGHDNLCLDPMPGWIVRDRLNGTYDVSYDDLDEVEVMVREAWIKPYDDIRPDMPHIRDFVPDQSVMYQGKKATIDAYHSEDGTYDLLVPEFVLGVDGAEIETIKADNSKAEWSVARVPYETMSDEARTTVIQDPALTTKVVSKINIGWSHDTRTEGHGTKQLKKKLGLLDHQEKHEHDYKGTNPEHDALYKPFTEDPDHEDYDIFEKDKSLNKSDSESSSVQNTKVEKVVAGAKNEDKLLKALNVIPNIISSGLTSALSSKDGKDEATKGRKFYNEKTKSDFFRGFYDRKAARTPGNTKTLFGVEYNTYTLMTIMAWLGWLLIGTMLFVIVESLSVGKALYASVNACYNIGWQSALLLTNAKSKWISMILCIMGMFAYASCLAGFINYMVDKKEEWLLYALKAKDVEESLVKGVKANKAGKLMDAWRKARMVFMWLSWLAILLIVASTMPNHISFLDALVFSVSAMWAGALGFIPDGNSDATYGLIAVFVAVGVPLTITGLATLAKFYVHLHDESKIRHKVMSNLTSDDLQLLTLMGIEGIDYQMTRAQFMVLSLLRLDNVSPELIHELGQRFDSLDLSGDGNLEYIPSKNYPGEYRYVDKAGDEVEEFSEQREKEEVAKKLEKEQKEAQAAKDAAESAAVPGDEKV
jgi:hypothetical protein